MNKDPTSLCLRVFGGLFYKCHLGALSFLVQNRGQIKIRRDTSSTPMLTREYRPGALPSLEWIRHINPLMGPVMQSCQPLTHIHYQSRTRGNDHITLGHIHSGIGPVSAMSGD